MYSGREEGRLPIAGRGGRPPPPLLPGRGGLPPLIPAGVACWPYRCSYRSGRPLDDPPTAAAVALGDGGGEEAVWCRGGSAPEPPARPLECLRCCCCGEFCAASGGSDDVGDGDAEVAAFPPPFTAAPSLPRPLPNDSGEGRCAAPVRVSLMATDGLSVEVVVPTLSR